MDLLGALIGLERQLRRHPAGLHTNALVALGSAAFVIAVLVVVANVVLHYLEHRITKSQKES